MYNEEAVHALKDVRHTIESFALPLIRMRKFNGVLNAIEMQVEDHDYSPEVVEWLGKALIELCRYYRLDIAKVQNVFDAFQKHLKA
jgi:hypothetical protein